MVDLTPKKEKHLKKKLHPRIKKAPQAHNPITPGGNPGGLGGVTPGGVNPGVDPPVDPPGDPPGGPPGDPPKVFFLILGLDPPVDPLGGGFWVNPDSLN